MAKHRETRSQRLLKSPDGVAEEDATLHLRGGLTRVIPLQRGFNPIEPHTRADRGYHRGVAWVRIRMTNKQFDSLQGVFEGLQKKITGGEEKLETNQGVFAELLRQAQGGEKTKRVWEVKFEHLGTVDGIETAELTARYIVRDGNHKETMKGRYEARAALNHIEQELKIRLPVSAEKAKADEVYYISPLEPASLI
jgi:hypothetical protein